MYQAAEVEKMRKALGGYFCIYSFKERTDIIDQSALLDIGLIKIFIYTVGSYQRLDITDVSVLKILLFNMKFKIFLFLSMLLLTASLFFRMLNSYIGIFARCKQIQNSQIQLSSEFFVPNFIKLTRKVENKDLVYYKYLFYLLVSVLIVHLFLLSFAQQSNVIILRRIRNMGG